MLLKEHDKFADSIMYNELVQEHLARSAAGQSFESSPLDVEKFLNLEGSFYSTDFLVQLIQFDHLSYKATSNMELLWTEEEMKTQEWMQPSLDKKGGLYWFSANVSYRNKVAPAVVGSRKIVDWNNMSNLGQIIIAFPVTTLERLIGNMNLDAKGTIQIIDHSGRILFSTNQDQIGKWADKQLMADSRLHQQHITNRKIDGEIKYIVHSVSEYSGWTAAAFLDEGEVNKDLKELRYLNMILVLAGVFGAILLTIFFSHTITRPLRFLTRQLTKIRTGIPIQYRREMKNKEVSILFESFNDMLTNLNLTVQELADKKISEKQAQLIAMKAQFRPHFLYNTLNTIYWTLMKDGQGKTAEMVLTMSDLLRYSIQPGAELVTLHEDLKQLERFIELQKLRFGSKLEFEAQIEAELFHRPVMRLLLQPLVENAISHGLETQKKKSWRILIKGVKEDEQYMRISIEDNGIGVSQEQIKDILQNEDRHKNLELHSGVGLPNLISRLKLTYGEQHRFDMSTSELGGLKVSIRLPLIWGGEQKYEYCNRR